MYFMHLTNMCDYSNNGVILKPHIKPYIEQSGAETVVIPFVQPELEPHRTRHATARFVIVFHIDRIAYSYSTHTHRLWTISDESVIHAYILILFTTLHLTSGRLLARIDFNYMVYIFLFENLRRISRSVPIVYLHWYVRI